MSRDTEGFDPDRVRPGHLINPQRARICCSSEWGDKHAPSCIITLNARIETAMNLERRTLEREWDEQRKGL